MKVFCSFAPGKGFKKEQEALFEQSAQKLSSAEGKTT
jgi:hypothetical protein